MRLGPRARAPGHGHGPWPRFEGLTGAAATSNQILWDYTNGGVDPGAGSNSKPRGRSQRASSPGTTTSATAVAGATNCRGTGFPERTDPSLSLALIPGQTGSGPAPGTGTGTVVNLVTGLNPCTDPAGQALIVGTRTYNISRLDSAAYKMPAGVTRPRPAALQRDRELRRQRRCVR
ncbi:MAG: hypothetical protein WDM88_04445 [Galbitalea sp.]